MAKFEVDQTFLKKVHFDIENVHEVVLIANSNQKLTKIVFENGEI